MKNFFFRKMLYSKCSFGQIECSLTVLLKKPNKTTEHICTEFENVKQLCSLSRKKHTFESSCGHVEGSFEKNTQKKRTKFENIGLNVMKCLRKTPKTVFLRKTFLCTRKCSSINVQKQ